jgi:hypothetical protein
MPPWPVLAAYFKFFKKIKHHNLFNQADFDRLKNAYTYGQPYASIYIPFSRAGSNQKDRIRFKNALSQVMQQLADERLYYGVAVSKEAGLKFLLAACNTDHF